MIVRLLGGPLADGVLEATDAPWHGDWLTACDADWSLYAFTHRDPATDIVPAEAQETIPRRR
ncbi:hypothetical protein ACFZBM_38550 [Streptomyces lavendulae]|uniref:hypothetical protein n=1 Tax=Streptomyces lavendulae TaxID=1914 RepID=UPI0004C0FD2D|nr:hypothetical protein [Streptomyces lavendulae]